MAALPATPPAPGTAAQGKTPGTVVGEKDKTDGAGGSGSTKPHAEGVKEPKEPREKEKEALQRLAEQGTARRLLETLEDADSGACPPEALAQLLAAPRSRERLLDGVLAHRRASERARTALRAAHPGRAAEWLVQLSAYLDLDEQQAHELLRTFVRHAPDQRPHFGDALALQLADFASDERACGPLALASLLRNAADPQHPYAAVCSATLAPLLAAGLPARILEQLRAAATQAHQAAQMAAAPPPAASSLQRALAPREAAARLGELAAVLDALFALHYAPAVPRSPTAFADLLGALQTVVNTLRSLATLSARAGGSSQALPWSEGAARVQTLASLVALEALALEDLLDAPSATHWLAADATALSRVHETVRSVAGDNGLAALGCGWGLLLLHVVPARADEGRRLVAQHYEATLRLCCESLSAEWVNASANQLGYRAVLKGLLAALLTEFDASSLPHAGLLLQATAEVLDGAAPLCAQFWQLDAGAPGRRALLELALARFPLFDQPVLALARVLAADGPSAGRVVALLAELPCVAVPLDAQAFDRLDDSRAVLRGPQPLPVDAGLALLPGTRALLLSSPGDTQLIALCSYSFSGWAVLLRRIESLARLVRAGPLAPGLLARAVSAAELLAAVCSQAEGRAALEAHLGALQLDPVAGALQLLPLAPALGDAVGGQGAEQLVRLLAACMRLLAGVAGERVLSGVLSRAGALVAAVRFVLSWHERPAGRYPVTSVWCGLLVELARTAARRGRPGLMDTLAAHLRADVLGACDSWRFARAADKWQLAAQALHALLLLLPPASLPPDPPVCSDPLPVVPPLVAPVPVPPNPRPTPLLTPLLRTPAPAPAPPPGPDPSASTFATDNSSWADAARAAGEALHREQGALLAGAQCDSGLHALLLGLAGLGASRLERVLAATRGAREDGTLELLVCRALTLVDVLLARHSGPDEAPVLTALVHAPLLPAAQGPLAGSAPAAPQHVIAALLSLVAYRRCWQLPCVALRVAARLGRAGVPLVAYLGDSCERLLTYVCRFLAAGQPTPLRFAAIRFLRMALLHQPSLLALLMPTAPPPAPKQQSAQASVQTAAPSLLDELTRALAQTGGKDSVEDGSSQAELLDLVATLWRTGAGAALYSSHWQHFWAALLLRPPGLVPAAAAAAPADLLARAAVLRVLAHALAADRDTDASSGPAKQLDAALKALVAQHEKHRLPHPLSGAWLRAHTLWLSEAPAQLEPLVAGLEQSSSPGLLDHYLLADGSEAQELVRLDWDAMQRDGRGAAEQALAQAYEGVLGRAAALAHLLDAWSGLLAVAVHRRGPALALPADQATDRPRVLAELLAACARLADLPRLAAVPAFNQAYFRAAERAAATLLLVLVRGPAMPPSHIPEVLRNVLVVLQRVLAGTARPTSLISTLCVVAIHVLNHAPLDISRSIHTASPLPEQLLAASASLLRSPPSATVAVSVLGLVRSVASTGWRAGAGSSTVDHLRAQQVLPPLLALLAHAPAGPLARDLLASCLSLCAEPSGAHLLAEHRTLHLCAGVAAALTADAREWPLLIRLAAELLRSLRGSEALLEPARQCASALSGALSSALQRVIGALTSADQLAASVAQLDEARTALQLLDELALLHIRWRALGAPSLAEDQARACTALVHALLLLLPNDALLRARVAGPDPDRRSLALLRVALSVARHLACRPPLQRQIFSPSMNTSLTSTSAAELPPIGAALAFLHHAVHRALPALEGNAAAAATRTELLEAWQQTFALVLLHALDWSARELSDSDRRSRAELLQELDKLLVRAARDSRARLSEAAGWLPLLEAAHQSIRGMPL